MSDNQYNKTTEQPEEKSSEMHEGIEFPSREALENQITALEQERDELKNNWLRLQAEMENVRRRAERDVADAHKYGVEKLIKSLLPVVDGLVRGLQGPKPNDEVGKQMREGMMITLQMIEKTLGGFGVQPIDPSDGESFDPARHEAMSMVEDEESKPNSVIKVLERGYELNGRVIKAAIVIVAK